MKNKEKFKCVLGAHPTIVVTVVNGFLISMCEVCGKILTENEVAKYYAAAGSNTPVEVLEGLSKDQDKYIRSWVARNPNTPNEVLIELSKDKSELVRWWVARNPKTPSCKR